MKTNQTSSSIPANSLRYKVARKYHLEDLASAIGPGSRLSNILDQLESGATLSNYSLEFLSGNGFLALFRYASKETDFIQFQKTAVPEQAERRLASEASALKAQTEQKQKDEAMQVRMRLAQGRWEAEIIARENDPKFRAKARQMELRESYDLAHYIDEDDFPKVMKILRQVDSGTRLSGDEIGWLLTDGSEYYTIELRKGIHRNEAAFHLSEFNKNKDPWSAVNASGHFRKCDDGKTAESLLSKIDVSLLKNIKLKSAIYTTLGGAKRDLKSFDVALEFGEKAHNLTPKDFRPCTLLGAVNIEKGQFDLGFNWYKKAVDRGYKEKQVNNDLRSIFKGLAKPEREKLRGYLLKEDPELFDWAK